MTVKTRIVNVRDFGAKGDYVRPQSNPEVLGTGTDDSLAFKAAIQFILNNTFRSSHWGHPTSYYSLFIPAGQYYITQPESLLPSTYTTPTLSGLRIYGDGAGAGTTEIIYNPSTAGTALMSDNNGFSFMTVENISFSSVGDLGAGSFPALNNTFLKSYSNGEAQHITFRNCFWGGGWKYLWHLVGSNTNSEWSWYNCGVSGGIETAFYIPPGTGAETVKGSDQFVNYNFFGCNFEVSRGNYIRTDAGGAINIWGGSIINTSGGVGDGTTNNTFFKLGLAATTANQGAYKLLVQGVRFEMRGSSNTKVIESEWSFGTVTFIGCDMEVHSWVGGVSTQVYAVFDFAGEHGPVVQWISCNFQGKHQYKYSSNGFQRNVKVLYQGCEFWNWNLPDDFIIMTNNSGTSNRASIPVIKFENCRGMASANQSMYIVDTNMNWHLNYRGNAEKRILKVTNGASQMWDSTYAGEEVYLPLNAIITSITIKINPGATGSTTAGWRYNVKTSEGTPTSLASFQPTSGDSPTTGFDATVTKFFVCDTDAKRHIVFSAAVVPTGIDGYCHVEYIA